MVLITLDIDFLNGGSKMGCELLSPALGLAGAQESTFLSLLSCHPNAIISSLCHDLKMMRRMGFVSGAMQLYGVAWPYRATVQTHIQFNLVFLFVETQRNLLGNAQRFKFKMFITELIVKSTKKVKFALTHFLLIDIYVGPIQCNSRHPFKKMKAICGPWHVATYTQ